MPSAARQQRLVADLSIIADPQERLSVIVDHARKLKRFSVAERIPANQVRGCHSTVWLLGTQREDRRLEFRCDAESPLVRGLVALLCEVYSGLTPVAVLATEPLFLEELGLLRNLSPTRRNGLAAVRNHIRELAQAAGTSTNPSSPP